MSATRKGVARKKAARKSKGLKPAITAAPVVRAFTPTPPEKLDAVMASITAGTWTGAALKEHEVDARQFYRTLDIDEDAAQRYARAKAAQMAAVAEEMREIQDEEPPRVSPGGEVPGDPKVDSGWVQWQKNRIETRKWLLAKLAPKKYGDRVEQVLSGGDTPVKVEQKTVCDDQMAALKAKLSTLFNEPV